MKDAYDCTYSTYYNPSEKKKNNFYQPHSHNIHHYTTEIQVSNY